MPLNQQATITARAISDERQAFAFNFQISALIRVSIAPKFNSQTEGDPAVSLTATVDNDPSTPPLGVSWALTSSAGPCSPGCGTLTASAAPSLSATYTPPNTATSGANASPTITATSVADSAKSDSFSFTLVPPPISVSISNKFASQTVGGQAVTVSAVVTNDQFYSNAGVTWSLQSTVGGTTADCAPTCGTLTLSSSPSLSATYTPPTAAPSGGNASPTITATSVTDTTKSDSFSFNIVTIGALFQGGYVFQLRGFDASGAPMAMVGAITSDGAGSISGGELDVNDNFLVTPMSGLSGSYTIDSSFNGIPRLTICIALVSGSCNTVGGANTVVLRCALSGDGTRGKIIEYDNSLALMAGSLLKQDPAALAAANVAGSYAFELDSDAGTNGTTVGRIVEAGQFTIGAGATSITGGIADAAQAQQPTYVAGGVTVATIAPAPVTAPDALGRGMFILTVSGNNNGNAYSYTTSYVYYVVNAQQMDLIQVDAGGTLLTVQSGTAQRQNTLTANSLDTTSVVALTGRATLNGAPSTAVIVGVLTVSGTGVSVNYEYNIGGSPNPNLAPATNSGSFYAPLDPATGRAILLHTFLNSTVAVYLYDSGRGFLVDITPTNTNHAFSGQLLQQAAGPFSVANHLTGNYIGLAGGSSSPAIPNLDIAANFSVDPNSTCPQSEGYTTLSDLTTNNVAFAQRSNVSPGGCYSLLDTTLGRGQISFVSGVLGDFTAATSTVGSFYLIGPRQFVAIGQGLSGFQGLSCDPTGQSGVPCDPSGVFFSDPQ
jgi:hypothetical protein